MCGSNKNKTTTNSTQSWAPPQYLQDALQGSITNAQGVAQTAYNPATNTQIAGLQPQQTQAFQDVSNTQGVANPYLSQATGLATQGAAAITPQQISANENPYTQDVISTTLATKNQQDQMQRQQLQGAAASAGALGGDRQAIADAVLQGQQGLASGQLAAGLNQSNFQQAEAQANANRAAAGQGAYTFGNLGQTAQGTAYTDIGQLANAGAAQQQQQQNVLNAATQNAQQQSQYPFQTAQWLAGIEGGLGGVAGGSGTGTSTTIGPPPNIFSQGLGAGLVGASLFKSSGGAVEGDAGSGDPDFDRISKKMDHAVHSMKKHTGQGVSVVHHVHHFDDGGAVDFGLGDALGGASSGATGGDSSGKSFSLSDTQSKGLRDLGMKTATGQSGGLGQPPKGPVASPNVAPQIPHGGSSSIKTIMPYSQGFADGGSPELPDDMPLPERRPDTLGTLGDEVPLPVKKPEGLGKPPSENGSLGSRLLSGIGIDKSDIPSLGLSENGRMALRTAGLGMMASKSPFFGVGVGEGGLAGMKQYEDGTKHQKDIDLKAKTLAQSALQHQQSLSETTRHNKENENFGKYQWLPGTQKDENGNAVQGFWKVDAKTGSQEFQPDVSIQSRAGANAKQSVFEIKKGAWLAIHPDDNQGALDYASGHRSMSAADIEKSAITQAQKDAVNSGVSGKGYDPYMQQRTEHYRQAYRSAMGQAPQPQPQQPPQAAPQPPKPAEGPSWWQRNAPETLGGQQQQTQTAGQSRETPIPVATPNEARKLPRGTWILLPDKSIGQVP